MRSTGEFGDIRPVAWIVGDGNVSAAAAEACGLRVARRLSVDEAIGAVSDRETTALLLVEIGACVTSAAAGLLLRCDRQARDSRAAIIVTCAAPALDAVAAIVSAPFAAILCEATGADRIMAIHAAMRSTAGVTEADRASETFRLVQLTDEVARIARALADMPDEDGPRRGFSDGLTGYRGPPDPPPLTVTAGDIRTLIRWRRRRDALVSDGLFADPVWDMMLDLAAAQIEGTDVSVSSLCIAAAVPATTALRWIKALTEVGLFVRVPDASDRRRVYIRLADGIAATVLDFLGAAKGAGVGPI